MCRELSTSALDLPQLVRKNAQERTLTWALHVRDLESLSHAWREDPMFIWKMRAISWRQSFFRKCAGSANSRRTIFGYLGIFMLSISCIKHWTLVLLLQARSITTGQAPPFSPHLYTVKVAQFSSWFKSLTGYTNEKIIKMFTNRCFIKYQMKVSHVSVSPATAFSLLEIFFFHLPWWFGLSLAGVNK